MNSGTLRRMVDALFRFLPFKKTDRLGDTFGEGASAAFEDFHRGRCDLHQVADIVYVATRVPDGDSFALIVTLHEGKDGAPGPALEEHIAGDAANMEIGAVVEMFLTWMAAKEGRHAKKLNEAQRTLLLKK